MGSLKRRRVSSFGRDAVLLPRATITLPAIKFWFEKLYIFEKWGLADNTSSDDPSLLLAYITPI